MEIGMHVGCYLPRLEEHAGTRIGTTAKLLNQGRLDPKAWPTNAPFLLRFGFWVLQP